MSLPSYEDWKRLSVDQRDYLQWETLTNLSLAMSKMDSKYADKRVEKIVYGVIAFVFVGFGTAILKGVYK